MWSDVTLEKLHDDGSMIKQFFLGEHGKGFRNFLIMWSQPKYIFFIPRFGFIPFPILLKETFYAGQPGPDPHKLFKFVQSWRKILVSAKIFDAVWPIKNLRMIFFFFFSIWWINGGFLAKLFEKNFEYPKFSQK